jgi:hypothetical protein
MSGAHAMIDFRKVTKQKTPELRAAKNITQKRNALLTKKAIRRRCG